MKLDKGLYYVGDPGFILPNNDLRMVFSWVMYGNFPSGYKKVDASIKMDFDENENIIEFCDYYWSVATPFRRGTLYGKDNTGKGVDWGCFGVVPWKWVQSQGSYLHEQVEFLEPFECSYDDKGITIGHLRFNYEPQ